MKKLKKNHVTKELNRLIALDEARKVRETIQKDIYVSIHDSYFSRDKKTGFTTKLKPQKVKVTENYNTYKIGIGRKMESCHRLVCEAFNPDFTKDCHVNHIDGNTKNNHLFNLEVCDAKENQLHKVVNRDINITLSIAEIKKIQEQYKAETTQDIINVINNININLLSNYEPKTFKVEFKDHQEK
ncbi:HNH endonuclease [Macrococcoides goetzii]|nr:HNH endonuclease [Macrococcus goetzii]TDM39463.1 HNH endonuclease [Macrococcus goetzii]TDM45168.1 HNH endonuclease [Macrococcus goetzii]